MFCCLSQTGQYVVSSSGMLMKGAVCYGYNKRQCENFTKRLIYGMCGKCYDVIFYSNTLTCWNFDGCTLWHCYVYSWLGYQVCTLVLGAFFAIIKWYVHKVCFFWISMSCWYFHEYVLNAVMDITKLCFVVITGRSVCGTFLFKDAHERCSLLWI